MKKILILFCLVVMGVISRASFNPPYRAPAYPPITDTLQWLQVNIGQNSRYYVGKPLSVLLDTLAAYNLHDAIQQFVGPRNDTNWTTLTTTIYMDNFTLYFGKIFVGTKAQLHEDSFWNHYRNNTPDTVNTHICYIRLTFTQKIPIPASSDRDMTLTGIFGPVEGICRPYIVQSVTVGEY